MNNLPIRLAVGWFSAAVSVVFSRIPTTTPALELVGPSQQQIEIV